MEALKEHVTPENAVGFILGMGMMAAFVKRGWVIFGDKMDIAVKLAAAEANLQNCADDVARLTQEVAEVKAERDAARAEIERLRGAPV